jgi:hypothetical protein
MSIIDTLAPAPTSGDLRRRHLPGRRNLSMHLNQFPQSADHTGAV